MHEKSLEVLNKPHRHKYLWLKSSGAWEQILSNPGHYDSLVASLTELRYPTPLPNEIEKDINRTFGVGYDPERIEEDKKKLRRILNAYGVRNPLIGYC